MVRLILTMSTKESGNTDKFRHGPSKKFVLAAFASQPRCCLEVSWDSIKIIKHSWQMRPSSSSKLMNYNVSSNKHRDHQPLISRSLIPSNRQVPSKSSRTSDYKKSLSNWDPMRINSTLKCPNWLKAGKRTLHKFKLVNRTINWDTKR